MKSVAAIGSRANGCGARGGSSRRRRGGADGEAGGAG